MVTKEPPDAAVAAMGPFHVVRLASDALDQCQRRVQQAIHGHRGRKDDTLYSARRTLHTGRDLLTDKQIARLEALFAHLRGSALGFRNLTNYVARSLLQSGGLRPQLHPRL